MSDYTTIGWEGYQGAPKPETKSRPWADAALVRLSVGGGREEYQFKGIVLRRGELQTHAIEDLGWDEEVWQAAMKDPFVVTEFLDEEQRELRKR